MATTCNTALYVTAGACYTRQTMTPAQQKALAIYAKVLILNGLSGTDYRAALATTLLTDASQIACGLTQDQVVAGKIAVLFSAAESSIGSPVTLATKLDAIKCLQNAPPDLLDKADLMLNCKIIAASGL